MHPGQVSGYLARAVLLYAVQEQLLVLGLLGRHTGGPDEVHGGQHHLVPLSHHQLA